jgi:hypothetical protein
MHFTSRRKQSSLLPRFASHLEREFVVKLVGSPESGVEYDFGRKEGEEMSLSKHTEVEMIGALKQLEAGRKAEDVAREVGVSKHTIYAWKREGRWNRGEPGRSKSCTMRMHG